MWYSASILFKSLHEPSKGAIDDSLWEDRIVLIKANDDANAKAIAESLGRESEHSYLTASGMLQWRFDRVERVFQIDSQELSSGTELFSRFLRESEVVSLLKRFD